MIMLNKQFDFYLLLKEELKNNNMTPRVLCSKMNKPSSWFVNIRKGFAITDPDEFKDLCKVLKIEKSSKLFNEMLAIIKLNYPDADVKDNEESNSANAENPRVKLFTFLKELSGRNNLTFADICVKIGAPKYTISISKTQAIPLKYMLNMINVFGISGVELTTLKELYLNSLIDRNNKTKAIKAFAELTDSEKSQPEEEPENFDSAESESKNIDSPTMPVPKNDTDDKSDDDTTYEESHSEGSFTTSMVLPKYHDESDYTVSTYRKKFADYLLKYAFLHDVSKEDLKDYFVDYDIDSIIKGTSSLPPYFHLKKIAESLHMNEDETATFITYGHKGRGTNAITLPKRVMAYIGKNDIVAEALYEAAYNNLDEGHFMSIIDICKRLNK